MTPEQAKTREFQESRDGCAERERTAARILAALTHGRMVDDKGALDDMDASNVRYAVALADALRAALAVKP